MSFTADAIRVNAGITPLLCKVTHKCIEEHNEWLKKYEISSRQAAVLGVIEYLGNGEINQKKLSDLIGVKESSISSIIKNMIKSNLIVKEKSKSDGRNYILKAGARGSELIKLLKGDADKFENKFYKNLSDNEKEIFKNLLIRLL